MKDYKELTFRDSFMFGKVTEDPQICREIVSILMRSDVGELSHPEQEKYLKAIADGKFIRLDILAEDQAESLYDVEMQNKSHDKEKQLELPKRSRYYQSMLDVAYLKEASNYRNLKNVYVIFICTFDPFGEGKYCYTFRNACREADGLELKDGTQKIFFNTTAEMMDAPEELTNLLRYIQTGKVSDAVTERIERGVAKARENAEWRVEYMKSYVYLQDAKYEGMLEGKLEGRQEDRTEAILELLNEIGPVPQELSDAIMSECNMDVLKKWHKISAKAQSIDEFIEKSGIKIAVSV